MNKVLAARGRSTKSYAGAGATFAFTFTSPPFSVSPVDGSTAGGTLVTITAFLGVAAVSTLNPETSILNPKPQIQALNAPS